jgi:tripartite-type tricarboxylate transporter receptor subunit TctC
MLLCRSSALNVCPESNAGEGIAMNPTTARHPLAPLALATTLFGSFGVVSAAEPEFPIKPIRLIIPFATGSSTDVSARVFGTELARQMGQQVIADNRAGAGGAIGMQALATAAPDGYTIGYAGPGPLAINPVVTPNVPYNVERDFQPISQAVDAPLMLAVTTALAVKDVKGLIALARSRPGELSNASAGTGTIGFLAGEYFKMLTGTRIVHIPYKGGGQAVTDVMAGHVQMLFDPLTGIGTQIQSGRLRPLAVTGSKRLDAFPNVPTMIEAGVPGFVVTTWGGILGPAGMPKAALARLNAEMQKAVKSPLIIKHYGALGATPTASTPEQFAELIRSETAKWTKVVKFSQAQGN